MATPVKKAENMKKHLTIAEREKREQAEQELERRFVRLIAPKRVKEDPAANAYWKSTIARMKGLTLLDNVDTDLLASYCLARAREDALRDDYEQLREKTEKTIDRTLKRVLEGYYEDNEYPAKVIRALVTDEMTLLKTLQAQERLVDRLPEGTWPHAERPPEAGQAARHRASSDGGRMNCMADWAAGAKTMYSPEELRTLAEEHPVTEYARRVVSGAFSGAGVQMGDPCLHAPSR